jgi:hypothetical protein
VNRLIQALTVILAFCAPPLLNAQSPQAVRIVINVVKADKQKQFENYLTKFRAALDKVSATDPVIKRTNDQTRVLKPTKPNEDGTYTYVFLMDPYVEEADYNMPRVLERAMSKSEADAIFKQFMDAIIPERHQSLSLVQTPE